MDTEIKSKRGGWGSNFGFLMASIGSAVGLGNIWGFPYKMGKSGGAVFLLLYLVLVVLVGVTVMLGELALGRRSGKSAVSTYRGLSKKYTWLGYAGIVCGFCIMCFYFVLGGIVLRYAVGYFLAIFGGSEFAWSGQGTGFFGYFLTDTNSMILFFVLYILLNILVVSGGVQGGIEKFCNVGMPALFCLLVFIILYIACQPGAAEGYKFMFSPDFSVFSNPDIGFGRVLKNAAGQMFFSLSIGLGVMMTYGSYLGKQEHLQRNALIVCGADTLIARHGRHGRHARLRRLRRGVRRRPRTAVRLDANGVRPHGQHRQFHRLHLLPARADRGAHVVDLHARAVHGLRRR